MSKFDSCLTSLNLRDAVPVDAMQAAARQYQEQQGMTPSAAFLRAAKEQLQLAQMEQAGIVKAVRAQWEAQGGAPRPEPVAEQAAAQPAAEPKPAPVEEAPAPTEKTVFVEGDPDYAALEQRAQANDARVDALSDDTVRAMHEAMGLKGGKHSVEAMRAKIKEQHPDDVEAALVTPTATETPAPKKTVQVVTTADGKTFQSTEVKLVGSAKKVRDREVNKPAVIGEFPVFVEQSGNYRMFTYNKKITAIEDQQEGDLRASMPDSSAHPFAGFTREQFLGDPKITSDANAADLQVRAYSSFDNVPREPFSYGGTKELEAKYTENGAVVYDGDKPIASYHFGDTLAVDKKYRRQGIAEELVYQWRMRNPNAKTASSRTKKSQALQEKVWDRIQREVRESGDLRASLTDMRTIEVDGQRRPIRNSLGELVAPDFAGQVEFWKNYTGPFDERGRPIVEPTEGDTRAAENPIASDIDAQVAQAVKDGTTVDKLLALIESESSRPELRELASALRRQNLQTKIEFGNPQGNYLTASAETANGAYRQSDDTAFVGKEFGAAQTILHELVHASTLRALQRGGLAAQHIRALHKHIKDMPSFAGMYGTTDPEEFISEALTSPSFRQQLADTPAPGAPKRSIWQKIVGAVRMLLGLPATSENVLARVMEITPDLFAENQARGDVADAGGVRSAAQWASEAFRKWFGNSQFVNADGTPKVLYHGSHNDFSEFDIGKVGTGKASGNDGFYGMGFYASDAKWRAEEYGPKVQALYLRSENPFRMNGGEPVDAARELLRLDGFTPAQRDLLEQHASGALEDDYTLTIDMLSHVFDPKKYAAGQRADYGAQLTKILRGAGFDGVLVEEADAEGMTEYMVFDPQQVKSATENSGQFDPANADIRASMTSAIGDGIRAASLEGAWKASKNRLADFRNVGLQFLGRRQLVDLYANLFQRGERESILKRYSDLMQQMDADKNESGAEADGIADRWGKLKDADQLADLMHDSTLAQIDPSKDFIPGDNRTEHAALQRRLKALSPEAQTLYTEARDAYAKHWNKVRAEIRSRIARAMPESPRRAALLEQMDATFYEKVKGVYFPLARFGDYVVTVTGKNGERLSVNFAETLNEADALRAALLKKFPANGGYQVSKVTKKKEFNAGRDAVSRGFMQELFGVLDQYDSGGQLQDDINQLYLQSMPDLSWAKHGIHRKGTPGFSQDARRAFAQNMFHGARYLAKLRYGDRLADYLDEMQDHVDAKAPDADYDSVKAQQVVDEMVKRHESYMNPNSNQLSNTLTSVGFLFYLGLSPASAVVNLTQTPLVTLPMLSAKYGFGKASAALLAAAQQTAANKNDISKVLQGDELKAFRQAVDAGVIDVSMAHDLAGIASGDDTKAHAKLRPVMKWASFMFHHGEKFNRQASLLAAYRLAREAGRDHAQAYESAVDEVYKSHFDYSSGNRARVMQGPVARVVLLFKQYSQNMIYTLTRNAVLAAKGDKVALKTFSGLLLSHAMAAGVLGLPIVGTLLSAATMLGGDDDEPWDAKVALRNYIADLIGQKPAEVLMHGLSRATPFDISGRVGLDKLILPDVQEGLEGARLAESWMTAALGPVAGIGLGAAKGAAKIAEGDYLRGLEDMLPVSVRNPIKALRLNSEGVKDRSGIPILDDTSAIEEIGQLIGFSPSRSREAMEGKSAVYQAERKLTDRRQALVEQWAHAKMAGDTEGEAEVREQVEAFNSKNPGRRISPAQVMQSVRNRNKRIREAEDGIYLPKKHADVRDLGRFATAGD